VVVDASVVVKWIFAEHPEESYSLQALQLLQSIKDSRLPVVQPPHWLAEVAAVVARLEPKLAHEAVTVLYALEFPVADGVELYQRACGLATALRQHVFDTLYHAVALTEPDATLVTADERYYRRAFKVGRILRLKDYRPAPDRLRE
jgi:predicted nucleic acid-binding protein